MARTPIRGPLAGFQAPRTRERITLTWRYVLKRIFRRLGWHLVRADYYSPIVDDRVLPDSTFRRATPMPGLNLALDEQLEFVEGVLAPYVCEWDPPLNPPGDELGFYLDNPYYGPLDANLLYAFVRHLRPARVLELGSGFSTLVVRHAAAMNQREERALDHTVVDPYPSHLLAVVNDGMRKIAQSPTVIDRSHFARLEAGDILFVDTTHVVKPGSEVNYLTLEVLPSLADGVIVHFHDIFRPFEYPRELYSRYNYHWQEQYLLQALLSNNAQFRVLCAVHALSRLRQSRMSALTRAFRAEMVPSGFWFEKLSDGAG